MEFSFALIRDSGQLSEIALASSRNLSVFRLSYAREVNSGAKENGIFTYDTNHYNKGVQQRIVDFIFYENAKCRYPILLDEDLMITGNIAAEKFDTSNLRVYEPKVCVHSSSMENGKQIIRTGALRSQRVLLEDGWLQTKQLGFTRNGEPDDYLDHINLSSYQSPWPERVVQSNQLGELGRWDLTYNPGYRFYFDADLLAQSGKLVRTGAPFVKVFGYLPLEKSLGYLGNVCSSSFEEKDWTPDLFTDCSNEFFADQISKCLS